MSAMFYKHPELVCDNLFFFSTPTLFLACVPSLLKNLDGVLKRKSLKTRATYLDGTMAHGLVISPRHREKKRD